MMYPLARGVLAATALAGLATAAAAATAHNSQAGSWGPNKHNCAPTPYFQEGGCVSAAIQDDRRYPFIVGPEEARPDRRLRYPGVPLGPFGD